MEFMRINSVFGPALSSLINKVAKKKCGISPEVKIENLVITQMTQSNVEGSRVEVTFTATISEEGLQALLMEVTK